MTTIPYWLRPYYALRHPPEDALAYQIAYAILAVGAAMSAGVHDAEHIDASLAYSPPCSRPSVGSSAGSPSIEVCGS